MWLELEMVAFERGIGSSKMASEMVGSEEVLIFNLKHKQCSV